MSAPPMAIEATTEGGHAGTRPLSRRWRGELAVATGSAMGTKGVRGATAATAITKRAAAVTSASCASPRRIHPGRASARAGPTDPSSCLLARGPVRGRSVAGFERCVNWQRGGCTL